MDMDYVQELSSIEKRLFERADEKRLPVYCGMELTPYCNLSCRMCYVKETAPGLPLLSGDEWLAIAAQAAKAGVLVMQVTGGEPMVHPEFRKIYTGLKKLGVVVTLNTNATLIDESMADFLAADMPRRVNVSLYGPNEAVYQELCGNGEAFHKTIRAIELMKARNIPVKINIVPNTISFPHLDDMLAICRQYELPVEMTTYLFEPIRKGCPKGQRYRLGPEEMAIAVEKWDRYKTDEKNMIAKSILCCQLLEVYEDQKGEQAESEISCRAGKSSCWLCWDGRMNACVNMTQPGADVCEVGFAAAWEETKRWRDAIRVSSKCASCSLSPFCYTCDAIALHENGTFEKAPQIMCEATKAYARNLSKNVVKRSPKRAGGNA